MGKKKRLMAFVLTFAMLLTGAPSDLAKAYVTSATESTLSQVYWNPSDVATTASDGVTSLPAGNDANSGSTKAKPVRTWETALGLAKDGATIYCMSTINISDEQAYDGGNKNVTLARYRKFADSIFYITNTGKLTITNLTVDGAHSLDSPTISVEDDGKVYLGAGAELTADSIIGIDKVSTTNSAVNFTRNSAPKNPVAIKYFGSATLSVSDVIVSSFTDDTSLTSWVDFKNEIADDLEIICSKDNKQLILWKKASDTIKTIYLSNQGDD